MSVVADSVAPWSARALDVVFPPRCAGCGHGSVAVLRSVPRRARGARPAVVRAMRASAPRGRTLRRLPAVARERRAFAVRVRGTGPRGDPSIEVLGVAERLGRARRRHGGGRSARGGRGHVGAARASTARRARLRPGAGARRRRGQPAAPARRSPDETRGRDRPAGAASRRGASRRDAGCVRAAPPAAATCPTPRDPGRRRPDDRIHGCGVRRGARARRRAPGRAAHGGARVRGSGACLYSNGLSTGSVVARGSSPVVDASRGRNDPRKATIGRPSMARFRCKSCPGTGDRTGRRR